MSHGTRWIWGKGGVRSGVKVLNVTYPGDSLVELYNLPRACCPSAAQLSAICTSDMPVPTMAKSGVKKKRKSTQSPRSSGRSGVPASGWG